MIRKKCQFFFFNIFSIFLIFASIPALAEETLKIRFATEATYPPYVYMNAKGAVDGFDAAIVKALCDQLQATCKIKNQAWDSLIPSLKIGKFDALFGAMAITHLREKQVDFTQPYYANKAIFIGQKNKAFEISKTGLKGKKIGVQAGTTFILYLQHTFGLSVRINRYASVQDALLDLISGRIDLVLGDEPSLVLWLKGRSGKNYQQFGSEVRDTTYLGKGNGIAVKKGNQVLKKKLNLALDEIKKNGTYQKIVNKYLPAGS